MVDLAKEAMEEQQTGQAAGEPGASAKPAPQGKEESPKQSLPEALRAELEGEDLGDLPITADDERGEDDEDLKGHLELATGVQRHEVDPLVKRHDPPVEQIGWPDSLAPEVVDEENAAIGLHLIRGFVVVVVLVVGEVESIHRELTTDHYEGALS